MLQYDKPLQLPKNEGKIAQILLFLEDKTCEETFKISLSLLKGKDLYPKIQLNHDGDTVETLDLKKKNKPFSFTIDFKIVFADKFKLLELLAKAASQQSPYSAVFFEFSKKKSVESIDLLQELHSLYPQMELVICADMIQAAHYPSFHELIGLSNISFLRLTPTSMEVAQQVYNVIDRWQKHSLNWEQTERYALALRGTSDGIWDWNLQTNELYLSPRWKEMLGYTSQDRFHSMNEWFDKIHPDDLERFRFKLFEHIQGETSYFSEECRILHKDQTYRWMWIRGHSLRATSPAQAHRIIGTQTDITRYKTSAIEPKHNPLRDELTGLPNRELFIDRVEQALLRAQTLPSYRFSVLVLDINRFKRINDSLGYSKAEQLLVEVSKRLNRLIIPPNTIARLVRDEFAILLDENEEFERSIAIAEKLQQAFSLPFLVEGKEIFINVSIGIASNKRKYDKAEDLLRDANSAINSPKNQGKAKVEMFETSMHIQAVTLLQLETDLRHALLKNEFRLFYQPIVSLTDGSLIGFEALLRWFKSGATMIPPDNFIPIAEEIGFIEEIGDWVLEKTCQQIAHWQQQFAHSISLAVNINLSSQQFSQPNIFFKIQELLKKYYLTGQDIKLELTESVLIDNTESAQELFQKFHDIGIKMCMDDFGTGYSSLSYLHNFSFDILKIDKSFVSKIPDDPKHTAIVQSIISLAKHLNIKVVAEGVESQLQLATLRQLGCDCGQGFLFYKPLNAEEATHLIARRTQ